MTAATAKAVSASARTSGTKTAESRMMIIAASAHRVKKQKPGKPPKISASGNIGKQNYFSALEGDKAVAYANYVAKRRGDTNDVGKFKPFIICHIPELVKVKPNKQHGDGNKFLNEMENMICNTDNVMEAGLLAICMCGKE